MIRHHGGRLIDWEPSSEQPILDSVSEMLAIESLLDLSSMVYCERYHFDEQVIIDRMVSEDSRTCQYNNDVLSPFCLDDES